jgi:hypothetical protein
MTRPTIIYIALALLAFGVSMRFLPHIPNATPLVAIAFVASRYLGVRWSYVLPLGALILSDLIIGFYDWRIMTSVYGSFALIALLSWISRTSNKALPVAAAIFSSSVLFFLITNGAVWLFSPWYEKSLAGLLYAYELGLPFFRSMLVGDMVYSALLFGVFEFAKQSAFLRASYALDRVRSTIH